MNAAVQFEPLVEIVDGQAFISTVTIAERTANQHKNVLELVQRYVGEFDEFGRVAFETRPFATPGGTQSRLVALLNEPQATLLFTYMRNSDIVRRFKRELVHAFTELRSRLTPDPMALLNDPAQLRTLLGGYAERVQELEHTVEEQRPKVQALDRISEAAGAVCITEAAKVLQVAPLQLFKWLEANNWTYRRFPGGAYFARQHRITDGFMTHKLVDRGQRDDGSPRIYDQALITPKGLARLSVIFEKAKDTPVATREIAACATFLNN